MVVVHLNGDKLDFRRINLRIVTRSEAMQRQKKRAGTTSRYKGVQRHRKSGRWRALRWRGELRRFQHLGYFELEIEAAKAYDEAARKVYGEYAWVSLCLRTVPMGVLREKKEDTVAISCWLKVKTTGGFHAT